MSKVTINNLYNYVTYEFENNVLKICWDHTNPNINSLMLIERQPYTFHNETMKYSCGWVNELKRCISWVVGNPINIRIGNYEIGSFKVIINQPTIESCYIYEKINEDGYLYTALYSIYTDINNVTDYCLCNCVYNDNLDEENNTYYILK